MQIVPFFTSSDFSHINEDTNTLVGSYLDSVYRVPYYHQKHHPIRAGALPNDSEALLSLDPLSRFSIVVIFDDFAFRKVVFWTFSKFWNCLGNVSASIPTL